MKTAMILAAGRGERLKPITNFMPKAMCKIQGIPLIEYHVVNLAKAGYQNIIINHAYLSDQIRQHLGNGRTWNLNISYSPEPPGGLETGGGIFNALALLGDQPFITVNADIFTNFDFTRLSLPKDSLSHLILVENPKHNPGDFGINKHGLLNNVRRYTFSGIASYHPQAFAHCKPGRYSVTPLLKTLIEFQQVSGELFSGLWCDIGSVERLEQARVKAVEKNIHLSV